MKILFFTASFLLSIVLPIFGQSTYDTYQQVEFDHLQIDEGLSQSNISSITEDSRGFIWIGTEDGLNRYDGYSFTIYRHNVNDSTSISDNYIGPIFEDDTGIIWIGTMNGLNAYHRDTDTFTQYLPEAHNQQSISGTYIQAIYQDRKNRLWIGTRNGGLNLFERQTNTFKKFVHDQNNLNSLAHDKVNCIVEDSNKNLWISTNGGLNMFDIALNKFDLYAYNKDDPTGISSNHVMHIYEDSSNNLWVGTYGGGLNYFDVKTKKFTRYTHDPSDPSSISHNEINKILEIEQDLIMVTTNSGLNIFRVPGKPSPEQDFINLHHNPILAGSLSSDIITDLYRDKSDRMWIGTRFGGINIYDTKEKTIKHVKYETGSNYGLSHNNVTSFAENSAGNIWIGTDGGGLNYFNKKTKVISYFRHTPGKNSLSSDKVLSLSIDKHDNLWIGMWAGGVDYFDPKRNTFTHFRHNPLDSLSISSNNVYDVYQDSKGIIWIGTFNGGLNRFDHETNSFTRYPFGKDNKNSLSGNHVLNIFEDKDNTLWLATYGTGLSLFYPATSVFKNFQKDTSYLNSLSHKFVNCIYQDQKGYMWIGTGSDGIKIFDEATKNITHIRVKDGLANNSVYGILEADDKSFWISSNLGISKLNFDYTTGTYSIKNFTVHDGLQSNQFNKRAYMKGKNGEMYFGGIEGFNYFHPNTINEAKQIAPIVFTNFLVHNKQVPIGKKDSPLKKHISETDVLSLLPVHNSFTIEYAALNYLFSEKNRYAYRMEGFDTEWNYVGSKREASYTNLDAGEYIFSVKVASNGGIWNEKGKHLKIIVLPHWWKSGWAKICFVLLTIGILTSFYKWRIYNFKVNKEKFQRLVKEQNNEILAQNEEIRSQYEELADQNDTLENLTKQAEAANQAKSIFLSNMSHELRTPLNAILGFAQMMARDVSTGVKQRKQISIISRSGKHLLTLINGILDIAKIETGQATLNIGSFDLSALLSEISELFHNRIIEKGLSFIIEKNDDLPRYIKSDEDKLRQVLINLLGNALKFTETGGVILRVRSGAMVENIQTLLFEVEDTGMGIDSDHLENIFEPFVQAGHAQTGIEGTGLGLSICKSFVALLGGEISVESKLGKGSLFRIDLEVALAEAAEAGGIEVARPAVLGLEPGQSALRILVVEDNADSRLLLNSLLVQVGFDIREAENGAVAVALFKQWQPHFIWMDMRMPVMDGYQATAKIRSLPDGDTVKIVALTGSAFKEQRQSILEAGCDEVMHKPFQAHEIFETMGEQLGVRYIYEEEIDKQLSSAEKVMDIALAKEMVTSLPEQLHNELEQAAIALDMEKTYEVLERISEIQPKLADMLRMRVEEIDFTTIRRVLNHE